MRRINFLSALMLCTIAVFTMSGKPFAPSKPGPVHIVIAGYPQGTFTATGALETTGTNFMEIRASGQSHAGAIHCTNSVVTPEGTFTILMNCQFTTSTGHWRIIDGTGAYTNLRGNGSLVMTVEDGVEVETLDGKIF